MNLFLVPANHRPDVPEWQVALKALGIQEKAFVTESKQADAGETHPVADQKPVDLPHLSGVAVPKPPHIRVPRCDNSDELGGQLLLLRLFQLGPLERIQPFRFSRQDIFYGKETAFCHITE